MLCEINKTDEGWDCMEFKDKKWVSKGTFSEIQVKNGNVILPITAGKVIIAMDNCKTINEGSVKILLCENSKG